MNYQRLYEYRFRGIDQDARAEVWKEIAVHVGRSYREPNGAQLVLVDGGPLQVSGVPLTVARRDRRRPASGRSSRSRR